jgi:PadR family transcriptional regulator, regulatory protein PadR
LEKSPPPNIRLTMPTRAVLDLLLSSDGDDPPWGYRICEEAGLGPGTVYPILERLEESQWIIGTWESNPPPDRPRRRTYEISDFGSRAYSAALAKVNRRTGRLRWGLRAGGAQ